MDGSTASTVCFHYDAQGERCRALCLDPALFCCATHLHEYQHTPTGDLLRRAAECILASTTFTDEGLPLLTCRKLPSWLELCNTLNALAFQGYHEEGELLTVLVSSIESIQGPWQGVASKLIRRGEPFERLVTRLYLEELAAFIRPPSQRADAETVRVQWNQKLPSQPGGRRQIDVLLRWQRGPDESLTVVECRDHEVEVSEMDAFVTLVRHVGAARGVFVSSVGFQRGARDCAALEGIEIRVVSEEDFSPESAERLVDLLFLEPADIHLDSTAANRPVPLRGLPAHGIHVMRGGVITGTLGQLMNEVADTHPPVLGSMPPRIDLPTPGMSVLFPDGASAEVAALHVHLTVAERKKRCTLLLPRRPLSFSVRRPLDKTLRKVDAAKVPTFPSRTLQAGQFYVNFMGLTYHCEEVDGDAGCARLVLLGDRQHGSSIVDIEFAIDLKNADQFYLVEDPDARESLATLLKRYRTFAAPSEPCGQMKRTQS